MQATIPFHLQCDPKKIARYVLLPGDPGRVPKIAAYLEQAALVSQNREFTIYSGLLDGVPVSVASTGIGGASAAIAMEELVQCGADTFLRVGTCGGMQPELIPGTLILPNGAVRMEGTSREYMPIAFPAVPDFSLLQHLAAAADSLQYTYQIGVVQCKDSFYGQHAPQTKPVGYELLNKWNAWVQCGCLASEMESAALFVVASYRKVRIGTVLLTMANQERAKKGLDNPVVHDTEAPIRTAVEALRILIRKERR